MSISLPKIDGVKTKGDVAAATLGFAAGFTVDVFLFPLGVPPGTTASVFAVAAVGAKNAVQSIVEARKNNEETAYSMMREGNDAENAARKRRQSLENKAHALMKHAVERGNATARTKVLEDFSLWEDELITDEDFSSSLKNIVSEIRDAQTQRDKTGGPQLRI